MRYDKGYGDLYCIGQTNYFSVNFLQYKGPVYMYMYSVAGFGEIKIFHIFINHEPGRGEV